MVGAETTICSWWGKHLKDVSPVLDHGISKKLFRIPKLYDDDLIEALFPFPVGDLFTCIMLKAITCRSLQPFKYNRNEGRDLTLSAPFMTMQPVYKYNNPDNLCYISGEYIFERLQKQIFLRLQTANKLYFDCPVKLTQ